MVYEKLEKIRGDLAKAKEKRDEAEAKVKQLELRLKEAEEKQILSDVSNFNLSPEQVAEFLQLVANGQLPQTAASTGAVVPGRNETITSVNEDEEREDFEDEDDQ